MKSIFENKELKIIGVATKNMKSYKPMFHSHGEILYVTEGRVNVTIDGIRKVLGAGDMCVVFPYAIHSYDPIGDAGEIYALFSTEVAGEFRDMLLSKIPQNPFLEKTEDIVPLLRKTVFYSCTDGVLEQKTAAAYLKALLGEIFINISLKDAKASNPETVRSILSYCEEHFTEDILVKNVADGVFVSERYVTKIFAEKVGCSFRKYINALRISKAVNIMESTSMRITEIMYECGFKNQSTFNKVFLEEKGTTPSEYRRKIKDNK